MNNEDIYNGITNIKETIILEADSYEFKKKSRKPRISLIRILPAAAAFLVFVGVSVFVGMKLSGKPKPGTVSDPVATNPGTVSDPVTTKPGENITDITNAGSAGKAYEFRSWCTNYIEQEYKHGETIEKVYEQFSRWEIEKYEIVFTECEGVELLSQNTLYTTVNEKNEFSVKFRVKDLADPGHIKFTVNITFKDNTRGPLTYSKIIYVCNIGENDYVGLDHLDELARYSTKIRDYLHEIDARGEHAGYVTDDGRNIAVAKLLGYTITDNNVLFNVDTQDITDHYGECSLRLVFFDSSKNVVYTTDFADPSLLSIPKSQWDSLLRDASVCLCAVETLQTYSTTDGPYYSNLISVP